MRQLVATIDRGVFPPCGYVLPLTLSRGDQAEFPLKGMQQVVELVGATGIAREVEQFPVRPMCPLMSVPVSGRRASRPPGRPPGEACRRGRPALKVSLR